MTDAKEHTGLCSPAVEELIAVGAAVAGNCIPCLKFHIAKARQLGVGDEDLARVVAIGAAIKQVPAKEIHEVADVLLRGRLTEAVKNQTCCRPEAGAEATAPVAGPCGCQSKGKS
jgi:AhpD family alkylhydroperoxidase